ncbi:MAG: 1-(5-phosphoribosyl)-5-[(5-phosphoribosylamino)methylideneamino]imidazole-4-carboxamide isomerase [bacterium]|nr:1-(5-phosphoribosyl)-5-[(5-phosphoribosylamino)methylideneamino]imidazole-4-carboxamide isomerase [bacterium]
MILYPAIDLRGGRCVRLTEGDFGRETIYGDDPVHMARRWQAAGARWLHVVDLDGARAGRPVQAPLVAAICAALRIPVQVGGGVRDDAAALALLDAGAARVVVGTMAARAPGRCARLCRRHPGRIAVGIDARDGLVRTAGWLEGEQLEATVLAAQARELGAAAIIYTDIGRDGTERGPDLEGTRAVARAAGGVPVIASGGVGTVAHLRGVAGLAADGVAGAIVGRALYTGAVSLADGIAALERA